MVYSVKYFPIGARTTQINNKMTVIVAGCGIFGLSTALELVKEGHKVIALDKFPVPSPRSAADDLNKIIRTEYSDIFYSKLALEALDLWKNDPLYGKVYYESGRISVSPKSKDNQHRAKFDKTAIENLKKLGVDVSNTIQEMTSGKEIGEKFPAFSQNQLGDGLVAKFNPNAGFGHASNSLLVVYQECLKLGVEFRFGPRGEAVETINGNSLKVASGEILTADKIVLALGAATGSVIDLQNQCSALGLFVTHIKLTPEEYLKYKDIPIFFSAEIGYFFPPDAESRVIKLALVYGDVVNTIKDPFGGSKDVSLPRYKDEYPQDTFPQTKGEPHVRKLLQLTLPDLSQHELINSKVCWISDSSTHDFLIDKVPGSENIYVATGDSGHGFKFLPNIGKYIKNRIFDELDDDTAKRWGWKNNPKFPEVFDTRAKRENFDIKSIKDWKLEPKL